MSQVAIKKCSNYNSENVQRAVFEAVGLLGGIEKFVKPGQKVLIKPNVLSARPPESGVCTHPAVIRAVIRLVRQVTGEILVGDSPGGFEVINLDMIYEVSGIKKVCDEEKVKLVKFDFVKSIDEIPFSKIVTEVDVIINVPKMKTHGLTVLTGAVKNMFGTVVGKYKAECHFRYPKNNDFYLALVKIFSYFKPRLNIMDGITSMEGNGPAAGGLRNSGLILASPDAVSLDAVFAKVVGINDNRVMTTFHADKMMLGIGDISKIEILGEKIADVKINDFVLPEASFIYTAPGWIIKIIGNLIRSYPFVDKITCVSCRICEKNCPTNAITIDKYNISYKKCIFCFCCHELCPHNAIGIKKSLGGGLFNIIVKLRSKWQSRR